MRTLFNIFAIIGVVIAVALTLNLYIGMMGDAFADGAGMAIVALQLWGAIGALVALTFGFIGRVMDRRVPKPASKLSNICIALGLLSALLIFAMPVVFG